jgi:alkanesulfonate monooxygenase SsuD/methylene tetrahydromethanopterin reductase-like flavin-dependent oxidoreductase (luciferase family)
VQLGLALPQYDFSIPGESPLRWETVVGHARRAEELGFASAWLSDHLFWEIERYGGGAGRYAPFECLVGLGALARTTTTIRLGTLVICEALRPIGVLAQALATIDRLSDGRLDVGLGAGYYEPEYEAIGMALPSPGERLTRLGETLDALRALFEADGRPVTYEGTVHRLREARLLPGPQQRPRPPLLVGGKGDRLLRLVAARADGWNTVWTWTIDDYRGRLEVLERACEAVGRDPATVVRTVGLYSVVGEDRRDLDRRWLRMQRGAPNGMLDGVSLDDWRGGGRLVGTVDEVREQLAAWAALGVSTVIANPGPVPFAVTALDDLEPLAAALGRP